MVAFFQGNVEFGSKSLQNNGQRDLYLTKLILNPLTTNKSLNAHISEAFLSPNPVKDQSKLTFTLSTDTFLSIQLINTQGQVVQYLKSQMFLSGAHELIFRPNNQLRDGVYWMLLQSTYYHQIIPLRILQK